MWKLTTWTWCLLHRLTICFHAIYIWNSLLDSLSHFTGVQKLLDIVSLLTIYAMVVCRSYDTGWSLAHGVFISRPTGNPDPLAKSRPTCKIQTHWSCWLGHEVVHIVTHNIQKLKFCFHQYFIYIHKFNKTMT